MALTDLDVRELFNCNGVTTTFAIPFPYPGSPTALTSSNVKVYLKDTSVDPATETLQTYTTHYTIVGTNVVMVSAPASTKKLLILRVMAKTQTVDYSTSGVFPADTHELGLDKLVMMVQELQEMITRIPILMKSTAAANLNLRFPEPSANGLLSWNAAGDALTNLPQTGLLLTQNQYRAGTSAIAQDVLTLAVTFSSAMDDANYAVNAVMRNSTDTSPDFQTVVVTAKSTTGFTVVWNDVTDTANYLLEWSALGHA